MVDHVWRPLSPERATGVLAGLRAPWWIAGGWAIDLFLGRTTRQHADLDVALLRGAEPALRACLATWDIQIAHDGQLLPWDGRPIVAPHHQLWARPNPEGPWALEFLLEEHTGDQWRYRRDARVALALARLGRSTAHGLPYLCPEVALLYKARGVERNAADFEVAVRELSPEAKAWLHHALTIAHPEHPWIERLR